MTGKNTNKKKNQHYLHFKKNKPPNNNYQDNFLKYI